MVDTDLPKFCFLMESLTVIVDNKIFLVIFLKVTGFFFFPPSMFSLKETSDKCKSKSHDLSVTCSYSRDDVL